MTYTLDGMWENKGGIIPIGATSAVMTAVQGVAMATGGTGYTIYGGNDMLTVQSITGSLLMGPQLHGHPPQANLIPTIVIGLPPTSIGLCRLRTSPL